MSKKLLLLLVGLALAGCNPFKVTDPSDPRFDVTKFDLNDYKNHTEIAEVLSKLFSAGDNRDEIETVLITYGGAIKTDRTAAAKQRVGMFGNAFYNKHQSYLTRLAEISNSVVLYGKQGKNDTFGWKIVAFYDDDNKVLQIVSYDKFIFSKER